MRTVEQVCNTEEEGFNVTLLEISYCRLAFSRKIECQYLAKEKDQNGLYRCLNPVYQPCRIN